MKNLDIQNYILDMLERHDVVAGEKLPGALRLAKAIGCAPPRIQTVLETLVACGILETRDRSGTYVRSGWEKRVLPRNISYYGRKWPFFDRLQATIRKKLPDFRMCSTFLQGGVEFAVTHHVLSHQEEYQDLAPLFSECFPDQSIFFSHAIRSFNINGKLCGIPFVFSPEVLLYNPELFAAAKLPEPSPDWDFEQFFATVKELNRITPGHVMNPRPRLDDWINFVIRSGGKLLDPVLHDPVCIDSPKTIQGLRRYAELLRLLRTTGGEMREETFEPFIRGEMAMQFGFRQNLWKIRSRNPHLAVKCVPLPRMNGCNANVQGAELIVFRYGCANRQQMKEILKFILSPEMQFFFGTMHGGIPFLRSAAQKVLNPDDPADKVFMAGVPEVTAEYNIYTENLFKLITNGLHRIFDLPEDAFAPELKRLAETLRTVYDIELYVKELS